MALPEKTVGFANKITWLPTGQCPGGEAQQPECWIKQNRTLATVYIGTPLGALGQGCRICGSLGAGLPDTFCLADIFYEQM